MLWFSGRLGVYMLCTYVSYGALDIINIQGLYLGMSGYTL